MQDAGALQVRVQELEGSLLRLQRECSQAVAAAQAVVGRPTTPLGSPRSSEEGAGATSVDDVVRQLIARLKVRPHGQRKPGVGFGALLVKISYSKLNS